MSYKWDDELIKKFLTLYRKHKCLWNPYSPNYRNCSDKNEAFGTVVKELDVPRIGVSDCLQQIDVIREKYKQEQLKAEKELKFGKLYTSKLPWFYLMSQMLCEVINDEENFSENPVTFLPCKVTKEDQQNKDPWTSIAPYGESPNFLYKPEKYVGSKPEHDQSGLKKPCEIQSRDNNFQRELKTVNNANSPWNRCPSCGWEAKKNQGKSYDLGKPSNNCKKNDLQIDPEIVLPLGIKRTRILNENNNIEEIKRPSHSPLCVHETNYFNHEINAKDINRNNKKVKGNRNADTDIEKCVPVSKKCNAIVEKTSCRDDSEAKESLEVITLKENNVTMCPCRIDDTKGNQFSKNHQQAFEKDQTNHRVNEKTRNTVLCQDIVAQRSKKISEFENERNGNENVSANMYDSRIDKEFNGGDTKFGGISREDKYERVCSRFQIIIPNSDREDENLEITRYEVRAINPQLSEYVLCPSSEIPKLAIGNADCSCETEISVPNRNINVDSARYGSIIQLNISHKCSRKTKAKKRSCTSSTMCTVDPKNDNFPDNMVQNKSFANKKIQTNDYYENESMQTLRNMQETRKAHYSKSARDQGCATDVSLTKENSFPATVLDQNENSIKQHQKTLRGDSVFSENPQIENSVVPADDFNHTKIFLNVIIKILQSDDEHERSEELQKTLDSMLDSVKQMAITPRNATGKEYHSSNSRNATNNDTLTLSTEYANLPLSLAPANRQADNINPREPTKKTLELNDTTEDLMTQTVELGDTTFLRPEPSTRINEAVDEKVDGNKEKSRSFDETNKSIIERSTRSERPVSLIAGTNTSNWAADSFFDNTNEFGNEEPIASSSRRIITQHRSPSELLKEFFEVLKCTMAMDGISQPAENGNMDCCNKTKHKD